MWKPVLECQVKTEIYKNLNIATITILIKMLVAKFNEYKSYKISESKNYLQNEE